MLDFRLSRKAESKPTRYLPRLAGFFMRMWMKFAMTTSGPHGYDISNENRIIQDAFRDYSQFLVGLAFVVEPADDKRLAESYFYSGFIMQFGREWFWVTAGHILKDVEPLVADGTAKHFRLIDHYGFGADSSHYIPFDYEGAWRYHVHKESTGLDFGAVAIAPFYRRILEKNAVSVVKKQHWRRLNPKGFPSFVLAGLADDSIERSKTFKQDHYVLHGKPVPNLILADQAPVPAEKRLRYERIAGRISAQWPQGSIVGMSGGPIFGIRDDDRRPPIIALQSSWLEKKRLALACPITVFGPLLEEQIRKRRAKRPPASRTNRRAR